MITATCPICEGAINLPNHVLEGQHVRCPHCYEDLTIIAIEPVELRWPCDDGGWEDEPALSRAPDA